MLSHSRARPYPNYSLCIHPSMYVVMGVVPSQADERRILEVRAERIDDDGDGGDSTDSYESDSDDDSSDDDDDVDRPERRQ